MRFGERIRELRKAKNLSQRALGDKVGVSFTYISKVENEKLDFGDYPSEDLIRKLAKVLEADEGDLFLLRRENTRGYKEAGHGAARRIPKFASLDDKAIDKLLKNWATNDQQPSQVHEERGHRGRDRPAPTGVRGQRAVPVKFPVPVEEIIEQVLGLDFDWDLIEELPGEQILGGLDAMNRKISSTRSTSSCSRRRRACWSTIGHEAGHYDIDIDRARLLHPTLPGLDFTPSIAKRHASKTDRAIEVLLDRAATDPRAFRLLRRSPTGQDAPEVRSAVDRYQSALLMPAWLVQDAAETFDFLRWADLYRLAELAQVTISNLTVRLQRLGLIYLRDGDTRIYRSKDEFTGQGSLF